MTPVGALLHSGKNVQKVTLDAHLKAYKNLKVIPRYRGHTIFHPIDIRHREVRQQPLFGGKAVVFVCVACAILPVHI